LVYVVQREQLYDLFLYFCRFFVHTYKHDNLYIKTLMYKAILNQRYKGHILTSRVQFTYIEVYFVSRWS